MDDEVDEYWRRNNDEGRKVDDGGEAGDGDIRCKGDDHDARLIFD